MNIKWICSIFILTVILILSLIIISCDDEKTPDRVSCLWVVSFYQSEGLRIVNAGGTYNFMRQINNDGPAECNNITLRYFLSTDEVINNSDTYLSAQETLNLASGGFSVSGINLTIPSSVTPGTKYYIGVLINSSSCTSNCSAYKSYEVTISGSPTDKACLWIPNWHLEVPHDGHDINCGQTYKFHREIANDGPSAANNIKVRYYLSTDNNITTGDTYLGVEETLNLANGGRSWATVDLPIPSGLTNGIYYVGILITSSSCTNTCVPSGAWNVNVSCSTPPPDGNCCLWIPNWHLEVPHDGHDINCGQTYTFHREVANDGPATADNIKVRYYLSTDNNITTADTYLGVEETLNLANGGRSYTTVDLPIPSGLTNGIYYVGILITSSSCTNTCTPSGAWNVNVSCSTPPPDGNCCLWIPNWHLEIPHDGHNVTCGQTHTFHREVANDGPAAANNIKVRYYLSTDNNITTSDTYLGVEETLNLANGGRSYTTVDLPIPLGLTNGQTYYVGILITSSSCTNTCTPSGAWNVVASCGCNSCLWIPNWHLEVPHDGHNVTCGQTHTFHREVANDGPSAANNIKVRYYLSTNSTITTGDTYLGVEETLNLANGGRSYTTVDLPIPLGLTNGQTYYVGILITSSSCTNTCTPSGAWDVTASCTTCTYTWGDVFAEFQDNTVNPGDWAWLDLGVRNTGDCSYTMTARFTVIAGSSKLANSNQQTNNFGTMTPNQYKYQGSVAAWQVSSGASSGTVTIRITFLRDGTLMSGYYDISFTVN